VLDKTIGPYRVLSELGSGGMGTVFLGEVTGDTHAGLEPGTKVALKVVHPHLLATPGFFKRFLREADIGKQVRHENVVATLDVDATLVDDKQVNYMVLEYVEGRSLREVLTELGAVPETLLRAIAVQMADGLAAIHAQGIIHRDLKPENVLITDDDRVRIMDLGVAKLQEASVAITREGQFAGSFLYAAPEQFRRGEVGPAADLYSLGVMLYELASGENPFRGEDASSVIAAHLNDVPPRLQDRAPEVSPFLAEVTRTLLHKESVDRFASAAELHQLLVEGEESAWWAEREAVLKAQTPVPTIGIRRESAVFGREAELGALREAWEQAKAGRGSTILVEGEPGIGRTRLIDAFLKSLASEDAHLLFGSYPPSGGLGGFSESIVGKFGRAGLEEALAPYLTVTPTLVPGFVSLLRHESAPTGSAPLQGDALQAVACHLMHALAEERPTVWCLDDIHFAPEESRQLVLALASALADHPVLLVLTSRPDLDMPHLSRLENFRRLPLGRLSPRQVIEVLRDALKSETLAEKLGGKIAYKSDGVPMFVFEMVRSLKEGSLLQRMPDGTYVQSEAITDIQVPSAVRDLIGTRLKSLDDDDRNLLDAAAVEGYEFDPDLAARVTETKSIKVLQRLASLERKSGVVRAAGAKYRFDHHQIHEVLYAELSEALKKGYHGLLAEAYAEREGLAGMEPDKVPGDKAAFVAMHHLRSMTPRAALPFLERAREHLRGAFRNDVFLQMAELALPIVEGEDKLKLLQAMGSVHQHLGEIDEADALLHRALLLADELGDYKLRCSARRELSFLRWSTGDYAKARELIEEAQTIAREGNDEEIQKTMRGQLGLILQSLGRYGEALEHMATMNNRGLSLQYLGRYAEALDQLEKARGEREDAVSKGIVFVNLGRLYAVLGDLDKGRATLEESRAILRSVGARRPESYALHRLGMVLEQAGDLDEAERVHQAAIAMRREMRYPYGLSRSLARLGAMRVNQDRPDEARPLLEEAYELAKETGIPDPVVMAAAYLTRVGGDPQTALDAFAEYEGRLRAADEMEARFVLWQATGDRDQLEAAHRLLVYARDHAPEDRREAMIENVPLHRDIMAAHDGA
jgi:serine/threonine protein kinase/tetratricopeptide (TPR) repeat protein